MAGTSKKHTKRNSRNHGQKSSVSPSKNVSDGVKSQDSAVQYDDVPDFPRGGASSLSKRERDEVHVEVEAEFDEVKGSKSRKRTKMTKKTSHNPAEDEPGSLFGDVLAGKLPRFANRITFKNISRGMKLWGVIAEVNEKDIVVSLPGGLRGLVRANEAVDVALVDDVKKDCHGDFLPSIFRVGQLVSSVVLQLDDDKKETGKRKVWLSLQLTLLHKGLTLDAIQEGMALSAYVKSIEDHGYILHFGIPAISGFLPKKSQEGSKEIVFNSGQLVQGVVKSIDRARKVVHLCCDNDSLSKCMTKDLKGISLDLLVPGMMVNARVKSTLENGVMLSFLTYFTGTVDVFHLQNAFPTSNWKKEYEKNKKVIARILFVDPSTRAVGLTMNPYLLLNKAPLLPLQTGDIYDHSKIVRVDKGSGLLLEIPSETVSAPAYVPISDVTDEESSKLEKMFKEGSHVRVRILGFRHLEGLAMGVLKASAFEGSVFTHADVKPGMIVKAKVISVNSDAAVVQFRSGVKAVCPVPHMSEYEISKPRKIFKVGAELLFRVLGCKRKRITVTHKKTLVKSKLSILSSYADASDGLVTHGWITKIEKHGCFVKFYNGVQGFAPRAELGLEPGCETSSQYHVGQVVKCRITGSNPSSRRINLSFIISPTRVGGGDLVKLGCVVSAIVEHVTPHSVLLHVNVEGNVKGTIPGEHLADYEGLAALLKSVLKPGHVIPKLLVLDIEGNNLILSAKYSLVHAAEQLPQDLTQMQPHSVIHGYICNIIETGCFVRFLGRLTGFCPRKKAMDEQKLELHEAFYVGQTVRSDILDVNAETGRVTLSLKQSRCSSTDISFIESYFWTEQKIADFQVSDSSWIENFNIGCVIVGTISKVENFGVSVSFDKYDDVFGFITKHQLDGRSLEIGAVVQAVVLDVAKAERLVELSLKPKFFDRPKEDKPRVRSSDKKRKREACKTMKLQATVNAIVEIVKKDYMVLSLPEYNNAIGYAASADYNTQRLTVKQFSSGDTVVATIMALPDTSIDRKLLLLLESVSQGKDSSTSKRARKKSSYDVGSQIQAEITEIKPLELRVKFGIGFQGRIHVTEANDNHSVANPFSNYRVGQTLTAVVVTKLNQAENGRKGYQWELSVRPSVLTSSSKGDKPEVEGFNFSVGQHVSGYIYKVDKNWVWIAISRHVNAQLFILDSACDPLELDQFQERFKVGDVVSGYILDMNAEKKLLRLVLRPFSFDAGDEATMNKKEAHHIHKGDVLGGRISKINPGVGGMFVQIGPHLYGKVHYTEVTDAWVPQPLAGYSEGQNVKCKVLEISDSHKGTVHVDLSLRFSLVGICGQDSDAPAGNMDSTCCRIEKIEDLHSGMEVQGYVKSVTMKGCFILLSREVDAKILIANLSDGYVEDLEKEFPVGKLVTGKILSVDPSSKLVEVTLKTSNASRKAKYSIGDLGSLHIGDIISGRIKRIESFGVFVTIDNTNMTGLCHISELSDDHIDNIDNKYRVGERVEAKILKVDEERGRISLGMRSSYINDVYSNQISVMSRSDNEREIDDSDDDLLLMTHDESNMPGVLNSVCENTDRLLVVPAESRAPVPPLEVVLHDDDDNDVKNVLNVVQTNADKSELPDEKSRRRTKKKEKEEREQQIVAAEDRLMEGDTPKTVDDFEKLVRTSPNSSFVWIKYMAFKLSLADAEGARSLAERALRTINITHETEKLNIWVAYLNLENEYGSPPEEAVTKVFQRALQYCDPLKLHLELLGLYERTEQHKLADDILEKMVKKFKQSTEVWLRRIQWILKQNQDGVEKVISRALLSLPQHDHIQFLSQVAIFEFKFGLPDRGRSLFEKILREYPKRRDLWSVYLDQEIRLGNKDLIRALFERATSLSLPAKKMQFLFKKYLNYEKSIGEEERIQHVVQKAREYVEAADK